MYDRKSEFREKPACSINKALFPVDVICQGCGVEVEIWPDEEDIICQHCGYKLSFNKFAEA